MKYVLGVLGVIFVVILVVALITRGGGSNRPIPKKLVVAEEAREGVSAVFTTQGRVVGEDQRRAVRIIINQNERRLEVLTGYGEAVEKAHSFSNTHAAFETFLVSLDYAGFDNAQQPLAEDERGVCPLGRRYIYELREHSQNLLELWGTSCSSKQGSFAGNTTTVQKLFEQQIPEYRNLIRGVSLTGNNKPERS